MQEASQLWDSGYTPALPLGIDLPDGSHITCENVVRAMPGRRYVFQGSYNDKPVFIKLFSMSHRARREWQTEQDGIAALHLAGVDAPTILYAGILEQWSMHVVVYAALPDAVSARKCWEQGDEIVRGKLLDDLVGLIARHHAAGLRQADLHLLNFVYSEGVLYTLDASDVRQSTQSLSRTESMDGLADLLALLPREYDRLIVENYYRYWQTRGDEGSRDEQDALLQQVTEKRRYKLRKYLEKVFRSCSAFVVNKSWREYVVYDRSFEGEALRMLLQAPDQVLDMQKARLLKDGNTCTVSEFELDKQKFVCKRYNIKHTWHALSRAFRSSRAACSWKNSHHLLHCGIATARPVALREQRFGPLRGRAWLFVEKIGGESLYYFLHHEEQLAGDEFKSIVQAFSCLFEKMVLERISHGDMKAGNFIYHDGTLYMIDLDSMRAHDDETTFAGAFSRDMRRFFKNWKNHPATIALFREVLSRTSVAGYLPAE